MRIVINVVRNIVVAALAIVVLALGWIIVSDRLAQPPPADTAPLISKAAQYHARIKRDTWGVPHIFGATDPDVAFGFAYAHAEDDFATIQEALLMSRGSLGAVEGSTGAITDYLVRLFRIRESVAAHYDRELPPDVKAVLQAYADGVNYYGALHPDQVAAGLLPVTGQDVDAGFAFRAPFFYALDRVINRLNDPDAKAIWLAQESAGLPMGSNSIAVAPVKSADGATRLLVNAHQPYAGVGGFYEAVLDSGQGWHVAGGFFPGTPFMLHGHNAHLGWGNTVNLPDLTTVYRLAINPSNPNEYRLDGTWRSLEKKDAALRVHIWGPIYWTVHKDLFWSVHGPVFKTDHGVFALRYAGMDEVRQPLQYYRLDKARNLAEWRAAMALQALPSINYTYADETGTIGFVYNAQFPKRQAGVDWSKVLPGDRSDLIWHGYLPFKRVPQIWKPRSGYVFNSNNTPFLATGPGDNLKPADFSPTMGIETDTTNRAQRVEETFGADPHITADAFRRYKYDIAYSARSTMAQVIAEVCRVDPGGDADLRAAQGLLKAWDRRADIHSRAVALAVFMAYNTPALWGRKDSLKPIDALRKAITSLKTHFGRIDPEWGQVNRFQRGTYDVPLAGAPDTYKAVYGHLQKDGTMTAVDGDAFIMFVTWDRHGKLSSRSIHPFGSAIMDPKSKHYADQSPLFVAEQTKPVLFTRAQLAGHVEADYAPGERH